MKERPILFTGVMVRALLDGSKTQTRRACKPMNQWVEQECREVRAIDGAPHHFLKGATEPLEKLRCPYGQPGDRLWVRETWTEDPEDDGTWAYTQYMGCKGSPLSDIPRKFQKPEHCIYREGWDGSPLVWRPSIHMPRWASRILLEIVSVRVERLQDIGVEEIEAEGVVTSDADIMQHGCRARVLDWQRLWESINGAGSWDANPWVWVVEFRRLDA
jgi:hypothetical protein